MSYVIAQDVGTSSVKTALIHRSGAVVATAEESYPLHQPRPGWVEQDANDYWQAVVTATRRLVEQSDVAPEDIFGMVFTTQSMGVIPVDKAGTVLHPNITWVDGRAEEQARWMMRLFGGKAVFKRLVGIEITGKDVLPKLVWLRQERPEIYRRTHKILDVNGYLRFRATGRMVSEWSGACSYSFNLKKKDWNRLHFKAIGWDMSKMPDLVRSIDAVGTLTDQSAQTFGLPQDVKVFGGCDDPQSAAIGAGAPEEGDAHVYLGTSAWVVVTTNRSPGFKNGAVCLQSADPTKNIVVGVTESAGANLDWLIERFYPREREALESTALFDLLSQEADAVSPGADRLIFTPWLLGERCPVSTTTTRGTLFNLAHEHTRGHVVRALAEGVAYNLRWIIENFRRDFGFNIPKLRVIGGGSQNIQWMQTIADVTGCEVQTTNHPKMAGAIGAAMCAFVGQGLADSFDAVHEIVRTDRSFSPRPEHSDIYRECFQDYQNVYRDLRRTYKAANERRFSKRDESG
jgi:xylulokinase